MLLEVSLDNFLTRTEQGKLIWSIITIVVLWLIRRLFFRIIVKRISDKRGKYQSGKTINYSVSFLGLVLMVRIWFEGLETIATFLGLLSAGLAIALKDPVSNLAGWLFIVWRRPFELGHRVQIGEHIGDVIDISMFQLSIMEICNWVDADQHTGRIIHIPNGKVFTEPLANYSQGIEFIWHEVSVQITYESNWEKAKDILKQLVEKHFMHHTYEAERQTAEASKEYLPIALTLNPNVYISVEQYCIRLTMRYLCHPRKRRSTEQVLWEEVLREFSKNADISFAYPTTRFYNQPTEGKTHTAYKNVTFNRATRDGFENL